MRKMYRRDFSCW